MQKGKEVAKKLEQKETAAQPESHYDKLCDLIPEQQVTVGTRGIYDIYVPITSDENARAEATLTPQTETGTYGTLAAGPLWAPADFDEKQQELDEKEPENGDDVKEILPDESTMALPLLKRQSSIAAMHARDISSSIELEPEHLTFGAFLGKGSFGEVWRCNYRRAVIACKQLLTEQAAAGLSRKQVAEAFKWEALRLAELSHPNIVSYYGICNKDVPNRWALYLLPFSRLMQDFRFINREAMVLDLATKEVYFLKPPEKCELFLISVFDEGKIANIAKDAILLTNDNKAYFISNGTLVTDENEPIVANGVDRSIFGLTGSAFPRRARARVANEEAAAAGKLQVIDNATTKARLIFHRFFVDSRGKPVTTKINEDLSDLATAANGAVEITPANQVRVSQLLHKAASKAGLIARNMVMEFCAGGALWHKGRFSKHAQTIPQKWKIALDIAHGLAYLHKTGNLHRDLKTENILLDRAGKAKLSDMGLATVDTLLSRKVAHVVDVFFGDVSWASPEECQAKLNKTEMPTTTAQDIYSYGMILWSMFANKGPYLNYLGFDAKCIAIARGEKEAIPDDCPNGIRELIIACWHNNPNERPTAADIIATLENLSLEQPEIFAPVNAEINVLYPKLDEAIHPMRDTLTEYLEPYAAHGDVHEDLDTYWQKFEQQEEKEQQASNPPSPFHHHMLEFLQSPSQVFLVLADGGVGKTLTTFAIADKQLAKISHNKPNALIPILLRPGLTKWSHNELYDGITKALTSEYYQLSDDTIAALKAHPALFILDGYDELTPDIVPQNIPHQLNLQAWPHAKLVITSRRSAVASLSDEAARFNFNDNHSSCYLLPFPMRLIGQYLGEHLHWEPPELSKYCDQLNQATTLRAILRNPFVLSLFLKSFARINEIPFENLTRYTIYQEFISHWLEQGLSQNLLVRSVRQKLRNGFDSIRISFDAFAGQVAQLFLTKEVLTATQQALERNITTKPPWLQLPQIVSKQANEFFAQQRMATPNQRALMSLEDYEKYQLTKAHRFLKLCPLQQRETEYNFIHKSFFEYFNFRHILRHIILAQETGILNNLIQALSTEPLHQESVILEFAYEFSQNTSPFLRATVETQLLLVIKASKGKENLHIGKAASNAITILNWMNVSLVCRNFQGVNIPNADLRTSILTNTCFNDANLQGVLFDNSRLDNAQFLGANLKNVTFGRLPSLLTNDSISAIAYHPTRPIIAVTQGKNIILYDQSKEELIDQPFTGHTGYVGSIAFSPDGTLLASGSADKTVIIWDVASQQMIGQPLASHLGEVCCVSFTPDGRLLAAGSKDSTLILWDVVQHKMQGQPLENSINFFGCNTIAFNPDGTLLATGGGTETAIIWDVVSQKIQEKILTDNRGCVTSVAFSPDGTLLAIGAYKEVIIWDVASKKMKGNPLMGHTKYIYSLVFNTAGTLLASGSMDKTVILWDVARHEMQGMPLTGHTGHVGSIAFSPDGTLLASCEGNKKVMIWNIASQKIQSRPLIGHISDVVSFTVNPTGTLFASGGLDGIVIIWNVASQKIQNQFKHSEEDKGVISVTFDSTSTLLFSSSRKSVIPWNVASGMGGAKIINPYSATGITSAAINSTGTLFAFGGNVIKEIIICHGGYTGFYHLTGHTGGITSVVFNFDSSLLASGSEDNTVMIWDVTPRAVRALVFPRLAKKIKMTSHHQKQGRLIGHTNSVNSVAFNPNGILLASGGDDCTVIIWDIASHKMQGQPLIGHTNSVNSVSFNQEGTLLASGGDDCTVIIWDVDSQRQLIKIPCNNIVRNVLFTNTNKLIVRIRDGACYTYQIEEEGEIYKARLEQCLLLTQTAYTLTARQIQLRGSTGLTPTNLRLLEQLGADKKEVEELLSQALQSASRQEALELKEREALIPRRLPAPPIIPDEKEPPNSKSSSKPRLG